MGCFTNNISQSPTKKGHSITVCYSLSFITYLSMYKANRKSLVFPFKYSALHHTKTFRIKLHYIKKWQDLTH